eukprot:TRINITY_DN42902_c0_g1_i1.p1 TRINITY_DN42902_c0_g1~~TRINITY_DN42902_c0_g1_i1.p1  ORF type:complete len:407 (+),score=51.87 TRINITY_DN42902_c0_g1_i1:72-1223(+)
MLYFILARYATLALLVQGWHDGRRQIRKEGSETNAAVIEPSGEADVAGTTRRANLWYPPLTLGGDALSGLRWKTDFAQSLVSTRSGTSSANPRIIWWDFHQAAGLDDRFVVLRGFAQIAAALNADLAVNEPKVILADFHKCHGQQSGCDGPMQVGDWWDEYYDFFPAFLKPDEAKSKCPEDKWTLVSKEEFPTSMARIQADSDKSGVLCILIRFNFYDLLSDDTFKKLINDGSNGVSVKLSDKISETIFVSEGNLGGLGNYAGVHIRRGDRGTPDCSLPGRVVEKMKDAPRHKLWILMTYVEEGWRDKFREDLNSTDLVVRWEEDLREIGTTKDNYARYLALQCLMTRADYFIISTKDTAAPCIQMAGDVAMNMPREVVPLCW